MIKFVRTLLLFLALVSFFALSGAPRPAVGRKYVKGRLYYDFNDLLRVNRIGRWFVKKNLKFASRYYSGDIAGARRKFIFNGINVDLNYVPINENGRILIGASDWRNTFRPLFFPSTLKKQRISTITIDMGHGGNDPGAMGRYSREKDITLRLGRRLAQFLRAYGYRVFLTRNRDVRIPLNKVSQLQRQHRSDLFISLHVNAAKNRKLSGVETFCLTPAGVPSSNSSSIVKKAEPGNRFDANNLTLAYHIQRAMVARTGAVDLGVKRARFAVLRGINAPGVLIETGFISNAGDEKRLNSATYCDRLLRGIVEGILNYHKTVRVK